MLRLEVLSHVLCFQNNCMKIDNLLSRYKNNSSRICVTTELGLMRARVMVVDVWGESPGTQYCLSLCDLNICQLEL